MSLMSISIIIMFIILIAMRRSLLNMAQQLDLGAYTPSDYCIQGSNMKFDDYAHMAIEDSLKDYFQSNFDIDPSHVMYVNPCFSIDDFYKVSDRFTTVQKHMGIIKAYCQEEGIEDGEYKSRMEAEHEGMPKVKTGMCSSAVLDLAAVQTEMNEVTDLIAAQEKTVGNQGDVEEQEKAFTKIVFVVFEYPSDCQKVCEG